MRYSSWGSRTEAEKFADIPGEFNLALSNHDAAKWLDMMRKNPRGAFDRCIDVPQVSAERPARSSCGRNRRAAAR